MDLVCNPEVTLQNHFQIDICSIIVVLVGMILYFFDM